MAGFGEKCCKGAKRNGVQIVIEAQKKQNIGACADNCIAGGKDVGRGAADVAQQQAGAIATQIGVEDREAEGLGGGRGRGEDQADKCDQADQAVAKALPSESAKRRRLARIIRATRIMATPRIIRLTGT